MRHRSWLYGFELQTELPRVGVRKVFWRVRIVEQMRYSFSWPPGNIYLHFIPFLACPLLPAHSSALFLLGYFSVELSLTQMRLNLPPVHRCRWHCFCLTCHQAGKPWVTCVPPPCPLWIHELLLNPIPSSAICPFSACPCSCKGGVCVTSAAAGSLLETCCLSSSEYLPTSSSFSTLFLILFGQSFLTSCKTLQAASFNTAMNSSPKSS